MRGSCVHQRRKVRTGTPICSQISACVRPCIASRCNRSSPLGLFHLLIWDSRAKVSPPYEKTARTGSASRALRAEDDPCACRFGYEKCRGGKGVKTCPGGEWLFQADGLFTGEVLPALDDHVHIARVILHGVSTSGSAARRRSA